MKKVDLSLYTDYLLRTFGAATAIGLSAMVEGNVSHDTIQEKAWTDEIELMCWHFNHCSGCHVRGVNLRHALKFRAVLMNTWFAAQENFDFIAGKGKHFVAALKDNRLLALTCHQNSITKTYKKRWKVEVFHTALKSNANFAKSPTRTVRTRSKYIFLSICL